MSAASEAGAVTLLTASPFGIVSEAHDLGFDATAGSAGKRLLRSQGQELAYDALSNLMHIGSQTADYNAEGNRIQSVTAGTGDVVDYSSDAAGYVTARGDSVAAAKALTDQAKANPNLVVKGGVLGESPMSADDVKALASLPSREELLAKFAGALQAPLSRAAGLLAALPRNFAYGLSAYIDKQEQAA